MKKDKEILEVLKHLRTMRDTWKEVMKLVRQPEINRKEKAIHRDR